jgi:threonine/homoserine/homoserine lactone efflux protein
MSLSPDLTLAYTAYLIGTASPGPSVLAVMGTAMAHGRARALALAAGVVAGSQAWGLCAAFGMAAAMQRYSAALTLAKVIGGAYLLWLAWQAARKAWRPRGEVMVVDTLANTAAAVPALRTTSTRTYAHTFARGLALHLSNPKAIFVWLSFVSLALPPGARQADALAVVAHCGMISATVFTGYALVFSTAVAGRGYRAAERPINALLAGAFGLAGLRLLLSGQSR